MMPFDPTVAIVFGTLLTALVLSLLYAVWYQSMKHKARRSRDGDVSKSIGLSELESLMHDTLTEALAPLEERLDAIDGRVRSIQNALGAKDMESDARALPGAREELRVEAPHPEPRTAMRPR